MKNKDASIDAFLDALRAHLHFDWVAVDHWEADRCAIALARANDRERLVYVNTYGQPVGKVFFQAEGDATGEEFVGVGTFEEACVLISQHLEP